MARRVRNRSKDRKKFTKNAMLTNVRNLKCVKRGGIRF